MKKVKKQEVINIILFKSKLEKIIWAILFIIPFGSMSIYGISWENHIQSTSQAVSTELNNIKFSTLNKDADGEKSLKLDSGKTIEIRKSISSPDELIAVYSFSNNATEKDESLTFEIKNVDGYAKAVSIKDSLGREITGN